MKERPGSLYTWSGNQRLTHFAHPVLCCMGTSLSLSFHEGLLKLIDFWKPIYCCNSGEQKKSTSSGFIYTWLQYQSGVTQAIFDKFHSGMHQISPLHSSSTDLTVLNVNTPTFAVGLLLHQLSVRKGTSLKT